MTRTIGLLLGLSLLLSTAARPARAADKWIFSVEKQEEKAKGRWSLADWLDTRDRIRMMDLWLAMHSPSPYEFYVGAHYSMGNYANGGYYGSWNIDAAAYAYIFGLQFIKPFSVLDGGWTTLFNLRVFGMYNQATNLTFNGGLTQVYRKGVPLMLPTAGASITVYIAKPFGLEGHFRHTFQNLSRGEYFSNRWQGGAFLDYKFLRIYGGIATENEGGALGISYTYNYLGLRLYF